MNGAACDFNNVFSDGGKVFRLSDIKYPGIILWELNAAIAGNYDDGGGQGNPTDGESGTHHYPGSGLLSLIPMSNI